MGRGPWGAGGAPVLLLLLLRPWPAQTSTGATPGEPVTPHWVLEDRTRRLVTLEEPVWKPHLGLVVVEAGGRELLLELEQSPLLSPGYTETHYLSGGQRVVLVPSRTDHCHYRGHVRGVPGSWAALSVCSGMRGLITLGGNASYYLRPRPVEGSQDPATHRIFRAQQLLGRRGACGQRDGAGHGEDSTRFARSSQDLRQGARGPKYLELYIVGDHALFLSQQSSLEQTKQRLLEVANLVDQILSSLDIRVVLAGLEVWSERDQSRVSADANATLWAFLQWRRGLWASQPHDSAQLLTGRAFHGATVGLAPVQGMCQAASSGGVSSDHSELPDGAAATMAHEIGHSLGLEHDADGCCQVPEEQGGCVMEASAGQPFPRVFSACSRRRLLAVLRRGGASCLGPAPPAPPRSPSPRPARCEEGPLEAGEACDCGPGCLGPCCEPRTCSLRAGARCSRGGCCRGCQLQPAGTPCRGAVGDCDLPEFCSGASALCPPDAHVLDGTPCAGGFCLDGACPTLERQCQQLWGPGSLPAPEACFQEVNSAGDARGNCGRDGGGFAPCEWKDALCGKLQCQGGGPVPLAPFTEPADISVLLDGLEVTCRGAVMLPEASRHHRDWSTVEAGTLCGPGMVCNASRCQKAVFPELERCLRACHNHGVCNSNGHCHCDPGWAPPSCEWPGPGGSVDSGPATMPPESASLLSLGLVLSLLLPLPPGLAIAWCCCGHTRTQLCQCLGAARCLPGRSGRKHGPSGHPAELDLVAQGEPDPQDLETSSRAPQPS